MEERRYALLIDADNVAPKYLPIILEEAKSYGTVSIRRVYGDWTDSSKKSWKEQLLESSIIPLQQYSYTSGKNASDSAMIIDAMDILYTNNVDGFIIVSSDSDFTRLAMRLREAGKTVIGMGESKTPSPFVKSCEKFKLLDVLFKNTRTEEEQKEVQGAAAADSSEAKPITEIGEIRRTIFDIIDKNSNDEGLLRLSELGSQLTTRYPDFDERNYGRYKKLSEFVRGFEGLKVVMLKNGEKMPQAYVKRG